MPDIYVAPKSSKSEGKEPKLPARPKKPFRGPLVNLPPKPFGREIKKPSKRKLKGLKQSLLEMGKKPSSSPLAAFALLPKEVKFADQEKGEKIVLLLRRSWCTNISWIVLAAIMTALPFVLTIFPLLSFLPARFQLFAVILWYMALLSFVFEKYLSWFFNVNIITDERVIDVDFVSLVFREISQAPINRIQDVSFKAGGLVKALFGFGDVFIQTAAETQKLEFESVPHPEKVAKVLNELMTQEEQERIEGRVR